MYIPHFYFSVCRFRYKDIILMIDIKDGSILHTFNMSALYPIKSRPAQADCLNGIAYDHKTDTFLLTGKLWDKMFHVKFNYSYQDQSNDL